MDSKKRKWQRYGCVIPCEIILQSETDQIIWARIINVGRGGLLIEADYDFLSGDSVVIVPNAETLIDRFQIPKEVQGTVRWGQFDSSSLTGLFYVGIEFDELLPLKHSAFTLD